MVRNPDIQDKCYQIITQQIGDKAPQESDRDKLAYIEATICECIRIRPAAPMGVPHAPTKTAVLDGYVIPNDATLYMNMNALHNDPTSWKNPGAFDPNNFLDEDGAYFRPANYLPFGAGRRICIGEVLSKQSLFLIVTGLLQKFKFVKIPTESYTLENRPTVGLLLYQARDYMLKLEERC